jgi:hypothetical protein
MFCQKSEVIPMKWEYACLTSYVVMDTTTYTTTLEGPGGQQKIEENDVVVILNRLGQEGWEVLGVETSYFGTESSLQAFWLKRPR